MSEFLAWLAALDLSWLFGGDGWQYAVGGVSIFSRYVISVASASAGLKYAEVVFDDVTSPGGTSYLVVGVSRWDESQFLADGFHCSSSGAGWYEDSPFVSPDFTDGPTFSATDVVMFALEPTTGKVWFGKVGAGWYNGGDPAAGTGETATLTPGLYYIVAGIERSIDPPSGGAQFSLRTQSSQFTGTIPSGFSAWYTA